MNKNPGSLTVTEMLTGLGVKVLLGWLYGYIFLTYYNGDDTWKHLHASVIETQNLLNHPGQFFKNDYTPVHSIEIGNGWLHVISLYLNDLRFALLVKSMAFMNLLSHGNYYVNVTLLNAIFFFGHYWLFRLMAEWFPENRKILFIFIFFSFLPFSG